MSVRVQVGNSLDRKIGGGLSAPLTSVNLTSLTQNVVGPAGAQALGYTMIEDATLATQHGVLETNATTIVSGQPRTIVANIKGSTRFRGALLITNISIAGANMAGVRFNTSTGVTSTFLAGAGAVTDFGMIPIDNGWWRVYFTGSQNGGETASRVGIRMFDSSGAVTYDGDGTSGLFFL